MKNKIIIGLCVTVLFIIIGGIFTYQTLKNSGDVLSEDIGVFEATYESTKPIGEISFWHYNKNEAVDIVRSFKKHYPNVKVNLKVFPLKDMLYQKKLSAALKSGSRVPDIIASDASFVKRFTNSDEIYMDLSDKVEEISGNMVPYTINMGMNTRGELKALTNKLSIGALLYKKSVAKKYLGVSEPYEVESIMLYKDSILKAASTIKAKSKGKVALFSSWVDLEKMYLGTRQQGWFGDNKFWMDQKVLEFIDFAKEINNNKYEAGFSEDTRGYDKAITDDESFMITVCSPSTLSWVVGRNALEAGKWGIAKPLEPFGWGGTWYGIYSRSNAKDLSWKFLKHLTIDNFAMKEWAVNHDELPNNAYLLNQKIPYSKTFEANLADIYDYNVETSYITITGYDDIINKMFNEKVKAYLDGKISSKTELIKEFKKEFKEEFPELVVK